MLRRTRCPIRRFLLAGHFLMISLLLHTTDAWVSPSIMMSSSIKQMPSLRGTFESSRRVIQHSRGSDSPRASTELLTGGVQDLDVVGLVAGQENYGFAVVILGEGIYSFLQLPSMDNIKVLVPPAVAAIILFALSGPMITSGDAASVANGLTIATVVSVGLGASYVIRLLAPYSIAPKEIAAIGLLISLAGLFSFGQNLVVDGFVSLPSVSFPSLPSIDLGI